MPSASAAVHTDSSTTTTTATSSKGSSAPGMPPSMDVRNFHSELMVAQAEAQAAAGQKLESLYDPSLVVDKLMA